MENTLPSKKTNAFTLLEIIAKYGFPIRLRYPWTKSIVVSVRVDDWTAEWCIIASNDNQFDADTRKLFQKKWHKPEKIVDLGTKSMQYLK